MLLIFLLLLLLAAAALYQGLTTGHYRIATSKLRPGTQINLCLITDLHSIWWGRDQSRIIRRVAAMQPDAILLGGDIFDDRAADCAAPVEALLKGVAPLAPCFYVTGSHDIWTWCMAEFETLLARYGVTTLHGTTVPLDVQGETLYLSGVDEPAAAVMAGRVDDQAFYRESLQAFSAIDPAHFNLLIAHRPEYIADYAALGFDLTVSGHCHGGQVRIPFLINGLFAPGQGLFPAYAAGHYQVDQTHLIVSRGLHISWNLPRIFNRPEVVHITLTGSP